MIVAVASGKGGTGKTTVATSLALALADASPTFLDCDVETPNAHISLEPRLTQHQQVNSLFPRVETDCCSGCGVCAEVCQFHAMVVLAGKVLVFPELCHGCGSCARNCPEQAIEETARPIGALQAGAAKNGIQFARGVLDIGEPMAVPVIRALKRWRPFADGSIEIRDAPPGTSCPVVETIRGADFLLLVTEPTPFGLHDLRLAVELARELDLPAGLVINKDGIADAGAEQYFAEADLPILLRIPLDRAIGEALARGSSLVEAFPAFLPRFQDLYGRIRELASRRRETEGLSVARADSASAGQAERA